MFLTESSYGISVPLTDNDEMEFTMPYKPFKTFDEVSAALAYDAETGTFVWKQDVAKNVKAGTEAGCVKACRKDAKGNLVSYRYIRLGSEVPAARVAWLLHYGEWPDGKLFFIDGDPLNLKIDNLRLGNCLHKRYDKSDPEQRKEYLRDHRKAFSAVWKDWDLTRRFGISLVDYEDMFEAQGGKCAICDQPETQKRNGVVKALAVDHNHETGKVRGLLCTDCNTGIGNLKDSLDVLKAAIAYLEQHPAA